jgi:vacuolar-type H+-ATPase subunit I/STV1
VPPRPQADWAAEVADRIDDVVAKVRANTSDRLVGIARIVVYGLLAVVMGVTAGVLAVIFAIRLLDVVIPRGVWIPYLVLGAIFLVAGLFLWSKRSAKPARD